ncbi:hypothetical protein [Pseudomonas sp. TE3610]
MQDLFDLITALLDWPTFPSKRRRKRVFSKGFVALAVCVAVVEQSATYEELRKLNSKSNWHRSRCRRLRWPLKAPLTMQRASGLRST